MNTEKTFIVLKILERDYLMNNTPEKLNQLINCLSQQYKNEKTLIPITLRLYLLKISIFSYEIISLSPLQNKLLNDMEIDKFFGQKLWNDLILIYQMKNISSNDRINSLKNILKELLNTYKIIITTTFCLDYLKLNYGNHEINVSSIGMNFPDTIFNRTVEGFEKELHEISYLFRMFSEVTQNDYSELRIKTLTTSDIQVFLQCAAPVAAALTITIERIVNFYKTTLEIKKLKQELVKHDVPDDIINALKCHIDKKIDATAQQITKEIIEKFHVEKDENRSNELEIGLQKAVSYMMDRVQNGVIFESIVAQDKPVEENRNSIIKISNDIYYALQNNPSLIVNQLSNLNNEVLRINDIGQKEET